MSSSQNTNQQETTPIKFSFDSKEKSGNDIPDSYSTNDENQNNPLSREGLRFEFDESENLAREKARREEEFNIKTQEIITRDRENLDVDVSMWDKVKDWFTRENNIETTAERLLTKKIQKQEIKLAKEQRTREIYAKVYEDSQKSIERIQEIAQNLDYQVSQETIDTMTIQSEVYKAKTAEHALKVVAHEEDVHAMKAYKEGYAKERQEGVEKITAELRDSLGRTTHEIMEESELFSMLSFSCEQQREQTLKAQKDYEELQRQAEKEFAPTAGRFSKERKAEKEAFKISQKEIKLLLSKARVKLDWAQKLYNDGVNEKNQCSQKISTLLKEKEGTEAAIAQKETQDLTPLERKQKTEAQTQTIEQSIGQKQWDTAIEQATKLGRFDLLQNIAEQSALAKEYTISVTVLSQLPPNLKYDAVHDIIINQRLTAEGAQPYLELLLKRERAALLQEAQQELKWKSKQRERIENLKDTAPSKKTPHAAPQRKTPGNEGNITSNTPETEKKAFYTKFEAFVRFKQNYNRANPDSQLTNKEFTASEKALRTSNGGYRTIDEAVTDIRNYLSAGPSPINSITEQEVRRILIGK